MLFVLFISRMILKVKMMMTVTMKMIMMTVVMKIKRAVRQMLTLV